MTFKQNEPDFEYPRRLRLKITLVIISVTMAFVSIALLGFFYLNSLLTDSLSSLRNDKILSNALKELNEADLALKVNPNDEAAHLKRAKAFLILGNLEGARCEVNLFKKSVNSDWKVIEESLEKLFKSGDKIRRLLQEAESSAYPAQKYPPVYALADEIVETNQGIPKYRALFLKGYLLLREGRRAEAEPIFHKELKSYMPLRDYVEYNLARCYILDDSLDKALKQFDRFIKHNPSSRLVPLAHLEKVNILCNLGRFEEAINECRVVLEDYPSSSFAPKALRKWAEILDTTSRQKEALGIRMRLIREFSDSSEAKDNLEQFFKISSELSFLSEQDRLFVAYMASGINPAGARTVLSQLVDSSKLSNEERAQVCVGIARCEYRLGNYKKSIEWCDKVDGLVSSGEWSDLAGMRAGWAYEKLKNSTKSMEKFWRVSNNGGVHAPEAAKEYWRLSYDVRDMAGVEKACNIVADKYPQSKQAPLALATLAFIEYLNGRHQNSRNYADRCMKSHADDPASTEAAFWYAKSLNALGRKSEARKAFIDLYEKAPFSYWGIRAGEIAGYSLESPNTLDPLAFNQETLSIKGDALAKAWELYDVGILDLALAEFEKALSQNIPGARCGLALVKAEQGNLRAGVVTIREAADVGDQVGLTPHRLDRVIERLFPRLYYDEVTKAAMAHNVPPSLLWGIIRQESTFNPKALSSAGARGLAQIMPDTGRFIVSKRGGAVFNPDDLWNPAINCDLGAWYSAYLLERFNNNIFHVLAGYNGGPGRTERWIGELPKDNDLFVRSIPKEETRNYTQWVYANMVIYEGLLKKENFNLVPF